MALHTNTNDERIRILSSNGYVGIGTDNPGYKLEVAGDIKLADTGTLWFDDTSGTIEKITATISTLDYYSDATHRFYESDNNAERATFDVNNASGRLYFDGDSNTYFTREATDCHVFVNAGSESLRINASGNVGIGTDSPSTSLHVSNGISGFSGSYNGRTAAVIEGDNSSGTTLSILAKSSGYSGIFFGDESSETRGQIQYVHSNDAFRFITDGGTEALRIDDGNVGINSTAPTEKLDVVGTVKATDFNTTSDQNLKTNIQTIENPLDKIVQIRGVNFEWKENNKPSAGVIAQEVEKVLPELVTDNGTKTVNYNGLIGLLIETVKKQQVQIDELNSRLSKLE